jgi:hypothetical protein
MREQLIGYMLAALEGDERAEVAGMLAGLSEARLLLEVLMRGLWPLEGDDHEDLTVPNGLAWQTCRLVREARLMGESWPE